MSVESEEWPTKWDGWKIGSSYTLWKIDGTNDKIKTTITRISQNKFECECGYEFKGNTAAKTYTLNGLQSNVKQHLGGTKHFQNSPIDTSQDKVTSGGSADSEVSKENDKVCIVPV